MALAPASNGAQSGPLAALSGQTASRLARLTVYEPLAPGAAQAMSPGATASGVASALEPPSGVALPEIATPGLVGGRSARPATTPTSRIAMVPATACQRAPEARCRDERIGSTGALALDRGRRPRPQVAGRLGHRHRPQELPVGGVCGGDRPAFVAAGEVAVEPDGVLGIERAVEPVRREDTSTLVGRLRVVVAAAVHQLAVPDRPVGGVTWVAARASASASASRSAASAWRRLSRARVRSARAATWLTPERGRQLEPGQVVELGEEERRALALGDPLERPLESAESWASITRCSAEGAAPCDSPVHGMNRTIFWRRMWSRATRWAIWYSQARAFSGFSSDVVVAIGLDERVLGQVRGELGIADHPDTGRRRSRRGAGRTGPR